MPHRKLARRFEPRYGVSQSIVEHEAKWLAREFEDVLIGSNNEIRERLDKIKQKLVTSDANVQLQIRSLPEREAVAIRCLLARDLYHLSALYEQFFRDYDGRTQTVSPAAVEQATTAAAQAPPSVPSAFKEWLFEC